MSDDATDPAADPLRPEREYRVVLRARGGVERETKPFKAADFYCADGCIVFRDTRCVPVAAFAAGTWVKAYGVEAEP